jgi:hypothetical protein
MRALLSAECQLLIGVTRFALLTLLCSPTGVILLAMLAVLDKKSLSRLGKASSSRTTLRSLKDEEIHVLESYLRTEILVLESCFRNQILLGPNERHLPGMDAGFRSIALAR